LTPLKNENQAKMVLENIENTKINFLSAYRSNKGYYNPYAFCFAFTFLHLNGIRKQKKNLNEMEKPFKFLIRNLYIAVIISCISGIVFQKNLRNFSDTKQSIWNTCDLTFNFQKRYAPSKKENKFESDA